MLSIRASRSIAAIAGVALVAAGILGLRSSPDDVARGNDVLPTAFAVHDSSAPPTLEVGGELLPDRQMDPRYDFQEMEPGADGSLRYDVRMKAGGSPALVGLQRLPPNFSVHGKDGPTFVSDMFFAENPSRTPTSIQPGDRFVLTLPADTFVVRAVQERRESFGGTSTIQEYVSERGDILRWYVTHPSPVLSELLPAHAEGVGEVHLSPDLPYLLRNGITDATRLTQMIYRVHDPDVYQMRETASVIEQAEPGKTPVLSIDRNRKYLDPVREAMAHAVSVEDVELPRAGAMKRYTFASNTGARSAVMDDAVGTQLSLDGLPAGRVLRVEYGWDGTVRLLYKTGPDDARGKRDPYTLRDDQRWAKVFRDYGGFVNPPVRWGAGEPSDVPSFPTARDPRQKREGEALAYDFLLPGRMMELTFRPIRMESDQRAEADLQQSLRQIRDALFPADNARYGTDR